MCVCVCPVSYTNIYIRLSPEVSLPTRCVFCHIRLHQRSFVYRSSCWAIR